MTTYTKSTPDCPSWCETKSEHADEAADPRGSWFNHRAVLADREDFGVTVSGIQVFDEQDDGKVESPAVWADVRVEVLSVDQVLSLVEALTRAARLAAHA